MHTIAAILVMVVRRSLANRRLLATVIVGVIMSAALMSSVVLYSDAIRDLGLSYALKNADPVARSIRTVTSGRPAASDYVSRRHTTDRVMRQHAGAALGEIVHYGRSADRVSIHLSASGVGL